MGSMIHLAVGGLEIDWGKNSMFQDHSALFQLSDLAPVPYVYAADDEAGATVVRGGIPLLVEYKEGYTKPLHQVVDRINLLGHTLDRAEKEFEDLGESHDFDATVFRFEHLKQALSTLDAAAVPMDYGEGGEDFGKFFRREIYPRLGLERLVEAEPRDYLHEASYAMENLRPEVILQLLALNPATRQLPVTWQFADVLENGWASRDDFVHELDPAHRFLVVTEGSSDANVLRKAFTLLRPHLADFFDYVDMKENYPFTGTGELVKFVKGLAKINIQNKVIVLFDNDTEGVINAKRCRAISLPDNIAIMTLPDRDELRAFPTIGPSGEHLADINGKAAAIECYLQLDSEARVRWSSYSREADAYQGALEAKDVYAKRFYDLRSGSNVDLSAIESVVDALISKATEMQQRVGGVGQGSGR